MNVWGHSHQIIPKLPKLLTYLGVSPFLLASLASTPSIHAALVSWGLKAEWIAHCGIIYAAIILSFLGGIHWGVALAQFKSHTRGSVSASFLFFWSNVIALGAWSLILLEQQAALYVLAAGFFVQWLMDVWLAKHGALPDWFGRLRGYVTPLVLVCLLNMALN